MNSLLTGMMTLGAGQGVFICLQLWRLRFRNYFGFLQLLIGTLAVTAIIVEQWAVFDDGWRRFPHALKATTWMPFLIGPSVWLFLKSLEGPRLRWPDALHYLPAALALAYLLPFYVQSGAAKIALIEQTTSVPLEATLLGALKAFSMFGYLIVARVRLSQRLAAREDRLIRRFAGLVSAFLAFLALVLALFAAEHLLGDLPLPSDVVAAVGSAMFFYAVSLIVVADWRDLAIPLSGNAASAARAGQGAAATAGKNGVRSALLDEDTSAAIYREVVAAVRDASLYREPDLRLDRFAETVRVPAHYLSYVINAESGRNFQSWLNSFRIEHAKRELLSPGDKSIIQIGLDAGFNSKASFNRAFKAETGQSPSEFRAAGTSHVAK
jgi:AraC-like DNA-binding protein